MSIRGQTILITGASSGLGRSMALDLSKGDNNLVLTARREQLLVEVAAEVIANGSRCTLCAADAVDPEQSQAVIDAALAAYGRIDIAILNAGGGVPTNMATAKRDHVVRIMRTNYDTLVNFLCPMIEHMSDHGGVIAYTGSPAGYFGLPKSGPYSAAKAAGRVLFDACRIELADSKIRFVALYPGFTDTDGLSPGSVPVKSLIISRERASREMLGAIERRREHHMFPKRIKWLMLFGRALPEPLRRRLLLRVGT